VAQGPVGIQAKATECAWKRDCVGKAVEGLEHHIAKYCRTSIEGTKKMTYAHYTSIIQSGKLRLVDEFQNHILSSV